jgi:hypothetical protein
MNTNTEAALVTEKFQQTREQMKTQIQQQLEDAISARDSLNQTIAEMTQILEAMAGSASGVHLTPAAAKRVTMEMKIQLGTKLYQHMKQNPKKPHTSEELEALTDGYPVRNIYEVYNDQFPKMKIIRTGERALTRYHVL